MQKGFAPILVLVGILVLAGVILFIPLPKYQKAWCNEMDPPGCTSAGWKMGPSAWDKLSGKPSQTDQTTISSPKQSPSPNPDTSPKPSDSMETANWKTYTNEEYNFLISYPSNKNVGIKEKDTALHPCLVKPAVVDILIYPAKYVKSKDEIDFTGELWVSITIVENENRTSPESFLRQHCPYLYSQSKIASQENIKIDDAIAIKLEYKNVMAEQMEVVIQKGKRLYFIHGYSKVLPSSIFNQILSTFKFLDIPEETGPQTSCVSNKDCWCKEFTGAEFIPGKKVEGICDTKFNRCQQCLYF